MKYILILHTGVAERYDSWDDLISPLRDDQHWTYRPFHDEELHPVYRRPTNGGEWEYYGTIVDLCHNS
jgi:hypothetical protein